MTKYKYTASVQEKSDGGDSKWTTHGTYEVGGKGKCESVAKLGQALLWSLQKDYPNVMEEPDSVRITLTKVKPRTRKKKS